MQMWLRTRLLCLATLTVSHAAGLDVSLPVVDLSADNATQSLLEASKVHGFVVLTGHGLGALARNAATLLRRALVNSTEASTKGWRRPSMGYGPGLQYKEQLSFEAIETPDGVYTTAGREDFAFINPRAAPGKAANDPFFASPAGRLWFDDVTQRCPDSETCEAFAAYYTQVEALSDRIMRMYSTALTGRSDAFEHATQPTHITNLVGAYHHGGSIMDDESKRERVSAHSDKQLFTILYYGDTGPNGLEVVDDASGEWLRVHNEWWDSDALQLNIGYALQILSNGWLRSTPHRVIDRTPEGQVSTERMALCFFYAAAYDAILAPQVQEPGKHKPLGNPRTKFYEENPIRYEPMIAGHLQHNYNSAQIQEKEAFDMFAKSLLLSKPRVQTEL